MAKERPAHCFFKQALAMLLAAVAVASGPATAQTADAGSRPDDSADKDLPVASLEELAALPVFDRPRLSDSGEYLAAFGRAGQQRTLVVVNLDDKASDPFVVAANDWRLDDFQWLVDNRLLLYVATPSIFQGTPVVVSRLVLVDPIKKRIDMMFKRNQDLNNFQVQSHVLSTLPQDPDQILMQVDVDQPKARRASLKTRRLTRRSEQHSIDGVHRMFADQSGSVRVGYGFSADQKRGVLKIKDANGNWRDYSQYADNMGFHILALPTSDPNMLYVDSNHEHPLGALYEFFVDSGKFGKRLAQHPESAIAGVLMNRAGTELLAVNFENELVDDLYLDRWTAAFKTKLGELLPDTNNRLQSVTPDRGRAIVRASASNIDPHYYLYEAETKSLDFLTSEYAALKDRQLSRTTLTHYQARDGLKIPAYVTLPPGQTLEQVQEQAQPLPFVVLPHGGPHSRDFLRFDWLTQVVASQGYGVLQMNFRGSSGYGAGFFEAGIKQWGQAMQDDISDGTHWLLEQGLADPERICIAGASYGGYAALMGVIKEPQLYRCAVSLAGVTDLPSLVGASNRFIGGRYMTRFIGQLWQDRKMLRSNSPVNAADQIQVPVLLVHGSEDRVVSVRQSRKMRRRLEKAAVTHEYLELEDGDHYLSRGDHRLAFARAATEFIGTALKAPPERSAGL